MQVSIRIFSVFLSGAVYALTDASRIPYPFGYYHNPYVNVLPTLTNSLDARGTCSSRTPCFDRTISLVYEGPLEFATTAGNLESHWALAGASREDVVQEGRRALEFFQRKHGLTFTMTDEQLLGVDSALTSTDGNAMILPFRNTAAFRSRVYSVTNGETSQFLNAHKDTGGWFVTVINDLPAAGEFGEMIPSGAALFYGTYIFSPCQKTSWQACHSILSPLTPWEPIVLRFQTRKYIDITGLPPTGFITIDWTVQHEKWGDGLSKGYICLREGTENTYDGREIITFPSIN